MAFLDDVVKILVDANVAVYGTNLFMTTKATIPSGDGPYLSLAETGGTGATNVQNKPVPVYERPAAQIVARAKTPSAARTMAANAYAAIGIENRTVNGAWYAYIRQMQSIIDMGLDENNRIRYGFNILAMRAATPSILSVTLGESVIIGDELS